MKSRASEASNLIRQARFYRRITIKGRRSSTDLQSQNFNLTNKNVCTERILKEYRIQGIEIKIKTTL